MAAARDPQDRKLNCRLRLARLALAWEEAWPLLWPLFALAASFVALALLGVLPDLPGWLHLAILAAFVVALGFFLWRLRRLAWPTIEQGRRRLERASGLAHGPLQALADTIASGADDPVAQSLWRAHRRRLAAAMAQLRIPLPGPVLPRHDPLGLRFAALLLLAVALPGGWRDAPARLERAVTPDMVWLLGVPPTLQVWITPPDYTREPPILLENLAPGDTATVPAGSRLLAELQGGRGTASLELAGQAHDFERLDEHSARLEMSLAAGGDLVIRQGWRTVGAWRLLVPPDQAPAITFAKVPDADPNGRLRFDIEASDDYGVAKAWIEVALAGRPDAKPMAVELPLAGHPRHVRQSSWHDLTSSPWAGLQVRLTPRATDDAGLSGAGDPLTITLPEHPFRNPVARAIIALRKGLVAHPDDRDRAILGIEDIYSIPAAWRGDVLVALALSDAAARLAYDVTDAAISSVLDILWQTALRVEEGDKPSAERAVDEAAQALEKALADNAPEQEIERLTAELQAAIDRMLRAMVEEALKNGGEIPEALPDQQTISQEDLNRMLDQMREMSRTGSRDAARQTLDQLRQMLDALRAGRPAMASREQMEQSRRLSDALQSIARDQQQLLDETYRQAQDGAKRGQPDAGAAERQEALRRRLGDAMQSLGDLGADIPDALGEAEQAMREANKALGQGDQDGAVAAQTEALDKLRQGSQAANRMLAQRMGGSGLVREPGQAQGDPLGRPLYNGQGQADDDTVKIPTQADIQKAREVLDELRRREGDAHRPAAERDYLDRLLRELY